MAILSYSEMPTSFTGHAVFYAMHINGLSLRKIENENPNFSFLAFVHFISAWAVNSIYCMGTALFCAPLGVLYHGCSSLRQKAISILSGPEAKAHANALAWEHFKAMLIDISGICLLALGIVYTPLHSGAPNEVLGWWFSSTQVRTHYAGPPLLIAENDQHLLNFHGRAPLFSGKEDASVDQCSYRTMRVYAIREWEHSDRLLPLNHSEILYKICVGNYEEPSEFEKASKDFIPARLASPSRSYTCMKNSDKPVYSHLAQWKTYLKIVGWVALAFIEICSAFIMGQIGISGLALAMTYLSISWGLASCLFLFASLGLGFIAYSFFQNAKQLWNEVHAPPELTFSHAEAAKNNGSSALHWLKQSALHGNRAAQRELALSLLAAVSKRDEIIKQRQEQAYKAAAKREHLLAVSKEALTEEGIMEYFHGFLSRHTVQQIDHEELLIVHEAVSWLRVAAMNRDAAAIQFLESLFSFSKNRLFRGLSGSTEEDRLRSLLEGFGYFTFSFSSAADTFRDLNLNAIPQAISESRKKIHAEWIQKAIALPKELFPLIAEYLTALDQESPFFTTPVPALPNPQ